MSLFLLEYDRHTQQLLGLRKFAEAERFRAERELRALEAAKPPHVEVVLLSARSRSDLERTHARYFRTARDLANRAQADRT